MSEIPEELKSFLQGKKCSNGEVYEFTLRQGYLPKHTNQIFEEWQKNDTFEVYLLNGEKARKKSFYIRYFKPNDVDNKKVYFKLK